MRDDLGFPSAVEHAITSGTLWRAKEILQGRLSNGDFDPAKCEQLGAVLLEMGETLAAGQYLWLSGSSRPEYQEAITAFLSRYERRHWQAFVSQFPSSARRAPLSTLPPSVIETLRKHGYPEKFANASLHTAAAQERRPKGELKGCAGSVILLLVVVLLCLGVYELVQIVRSWIHDS